MAGAVDKLQNWNTTEDLMSAYRGAMTRDQAFEKNMNEFKQLFQPNVEAEQKRQAACGAIQ